MFEVVGFSLMTLVTIMEFILLSLCEVDIGGVNNINTKNEFGMKNLNPMIELEQILVGQIYDALQGGVVEAVLKKAKLNSG